MKIYGSIEDALYDPASLVTISSEVLPYDPYDALAPEGYWEQVLFVVREDKEANFSLYAKYSVFVPREDHASA